MGVYFPTSEFQATTCHLVPPPCSATRQIAVALGGRVTTWVTNRIALDGSLWYSPSTRTDNFVAPNLRVLLGLIRGRGTLVYVAGGAAFVSHTHGASNGAVVGGGAHLHVVPSLAVRAEFEQYFFSYRGSPERDRVVSLGLSVDIPDRGQ
jgi:hypothetical protein